MSIVEIIKKEANKKGHTLASLERALGFGNGSIRKWDSNDPSKERIIKVANFLNIPLNRLLTGKYETSYCSTDTVETKSSIFTLTAEEELLIENYRILSREERKKIFQHIIITAAASTTPPPMSAPPTPTDIIPPRADSADAPDNRSQSSS